MRAPVVPQGEPSFHRDGIESISAPSCVKLTSVFLPHHLLTLKQSGSDRAKRRKFQHFPSMQHPPYYPPGMPMGHPGMPMGPMPPMPYDLGIDVSATLSTLYQL